MLSQGFSPFFIILPPGLLNRVTISCCNRLQTPHPLAHFPERQNCSGLVPSPSFQQVVPLPPSPWCFTNFSHFPTSWTNPAFFLIDSHPQGGKLLAADNGRAAHLTGEATSKGSCPQTLSVPGPSQTQTPPSLLKIFRALVASTSGRPVGGQIPQHPPSAVSPCGKWMESLAQPLVGCTKFSGLSRMRTQGCFPPKRKAPAHPAPCTSIPPYARLPTGRAGRYTNKELVNEINERGRPAHI